MTKEMMRFVFAIIILISIMIFGYPTLYKYDKLDQKYPVKINRITGKTQILSGYGWTTVDGNVTSASIQEKQLSPTPSSPEPTKPETYNGETFDQFYERVLKELNPGQSIPDKSYLYLDWSRASLGINDSVVEPKDYFTIGSSKDEVKKAMGIPKSMDEEFGNWYYGNSHIKFKSDKVFEYSNVDGNLRVR